jgi:hypothetical protein
VHPEEFIEMAKELALWKPHYVGEVCSRTIVNRAYIGSMLIIAMRLQSSLNVKFPRTSGFYASVEEELGKTIGHGASQKLAQLRSWRLDADYDLDILFNGSMAKESRIVANELITLVKEKI